MLPTSEMVPRGLCFLFWGCTIRPAMRNKINVTLGASKIFLSIELRPFFRETIYHSDCRSILSFLHASNIIFPLWNWQAILKSDPEFEIQQLMIIYENCFKKELNYVLSINSLCSGSYSMIIEQFVIKMFTCQWKGQYNVF